MSKSLDYAPRDPRSRMMNLPANLPTTRIIVASALSVLLSACADDVVEGSDERIGLFFDAAAVEGLEYETATKNGVTTAAGEFEFISGETVTFSLGNQELPEIQAFDTVTPLTIFGTNDFSDARVTNLSRILQTLDTDTDTSNGIVLPDADLLGNVTTGDSLDFASADFETQAATVIAALDSELTLEAAAQMLVDAGTASSALMQGLIGEQIVGEGCTSDHPSVGRTAELSTIAHDVSGTVTILDDCTIEVTNFNYDGGGVNVFFYAAQDGNYGSPTAMPIGPQLVGTVRTNDTLRLDIPDNLTLDDFNSLSVWCIPFDASFGDTIF